MPTNAHTVLPSVIGDGDAANGRVEQSAHAERGNVNGERAGRPEREVTAGVAEACAVVGEAAGDEVARERLVGGEEDVEGSALGDLRDEAAGCAIGDIDAQVGVGGEDVSEDEAEVGGGGDGEAVGVMRAGERGERQEDERAAG